MKIKNFTGFMLGNENNMHQIGAPWMNYDARVWVCPNLAKAKKVLQESQQKMCLEPGCVWTVIYQVSGRNLLFEQANNGLLYTDVPTKIFVDRIAHRQSPQVVGEEFLLQNAKRQSAFFDLVKERKK